MGNKGRNSGDSSVDIVECPVFTWNEVIDKYFCLDIMKFGGVY
jgi:hypothetical protein